MTVCETPEDYRKMLEYEKIALLAQMRDKIKGLPTDGDDGKDGCEFKTDGFYVRKSDVLSIIEGEE